MLSKRLSAESRLIHSRSKDFWDHSEEAEQSQWMTSWPKLFSYTHLLPLAPVMPLLKLKLYVSAPNMDLRIWGLFKSISLNMSHWLYAISLSSLSPVGTVGSCGLMMRWFLPSALYINCKKWAVFGHEILLWYQKPVNKDLFWCKMKNDHPLSPHILQNLPFGDLSLVSSQHNGQRPQPSSASRILAKFHVELLNCCDHQRP